MSRKFIFIALLVAILTAGATLYFNFRRNSARTAKALPELMMTARNNYGKTYFDMEIKDRFYVKKWLAENSLPAKYL